jgi:hypothetical protein
MMFLSCVRGDSPKIWYPLKNIQHLSSQKFDTINLQMPRVPIIGIRMIVKAFGRGKKTTFYPKFCI